MNRKNVQQVTGGVILSYLLIALNAIYGIVLTPYIISTLGAVEYGVYKTIGSLSSSLMVIDFGIGGTVTRYIAKYRAENDKKSIPNFLGMMLLETMAILFILICVCVFTYTKIDKIYGNTFSAENLILAQKLFVIVSANMFLTVIQNVIDGILSGNNCFVCLNGVKLISLLARIALLVILLNKVPSAITLVAINLLLSLATLTYECIYSFKRCGTRVRFTCIDKSIFIESFGYTMIMFASTVINQVNSNLDNVVIGAVIGAKAVAIYSMGLTLFGMFEQLSTTISGVMLPSVTNVLHEKDGMTHVKKLVEECGRAQLTLLAAAFVGFLVLGKRFIYLWLGDGFDDVYNITLILMFPCLFTATVNVCISILRAKNKLLFRTSILLCTTILNALITYFGTKYFGYYCAAFGTALSLIVGVIFIINIYYTKVFGFSMMNVYKNIFQGIFICALLSAIPTFLLSRILSNNWGAFLGCVMVYVVCYIFFLGTIGLNPSEKRKIVYLVKGRKGQR